MNSPRSLIACHQLGIIPDELYYQDFEVYCHMNPEMIGLPKEIQKIRFDNINKYRKETIEIVKEQRNKIIESEKEKDKNKINNNCNDNKNENGFEEKEIKNLDEQLDSIIDREKKDIEKLKRRQKNEIEAEIENKIRVK